MQARAVGLLAEAASYCDDDTRLQRVVPYLLAALGDRGGGRPVYGAALPGRSGAPINSHLEALLFLVTPGFQVS